MIQTTTLPDYMELQGDNNSPHVIDVKPDLMGNLIKKGLAQKQEVMIFNPRSRDCQKLRDPSQYPQLEGLGVTARTLTTQRDGKGTPTAQITLWERKAAPGKKHYILFTGKSGHVADIGALPPGVKVDGYDRHDGLNLLKEVAKDGAGFTLVTMRGYGNNIGVPGEKGFQQDLEALHEDWKMRCEQQPETMPALDKVVIAGVSLGTANATYLHYLMGKDKDLRKDGQKPPGLVLVNPPSRFLAVADHTLQQQPFKYARIKKLVPFKDTIRQLAFKVPSQQLEAMLRHHFRTDETLAKLDKETKILFITSQYDKQVPAEHSATLMKIAEDNGFTDVNQVVYEKKGHLNLPVASIVNDMKEIFESEHSAVVRRSVPESEADLENHMTVMRDGARTPSALPDEKHDRPLREARHEIASVEGIVAEKLAASKVAQLNAERAYSTAEATPPL